MGELLGQCLGLISGSRWKRLKAVIEPPFLHSQAINLLPAIERRTEAYFAKLNRHERLSRGLINPVEDLKFLPFWVVAEALYGVLTPEAEEELQALAQEREFLFKKVIQGGLTRFSWSKWVPTVTNQRLRSFQSAWSTFNDNAYERALLSGEQTPIVQMIEAQKQHRCSRAELDQTLDEMLFANLDVTIGGLSWNLLFLAANPTVQESLCREMLEANTGNEGKTRYIHNATTTLLARCVLEAGRLKPLAAFSVPQAAPTARILDGYRIPQGTAFIVDTYALNVRDPFWGDDGRLYRPSRWSGLAPAAVRYHFWRFGFGPRTCLGRHLADLMLRSIVAYLVENYQLRLDEQQDSWRRDMETWITHPKIEMQCQRRSLNGAQHDMQRSGRIKSAIEFHCSISD